MDFAYNPPKKFNGVRLDGRDITYNIIPDVDFKFFITANVSTRAKRRFKELKGLNSNISLSEVLKVSKNVIKATIIEKLLLSRKPKIILINTTNLTKRACF